MVSVSGTAPGSGRVLFLLRNPHRDPRYWHSLAQGWAWTSPGASVRHLWHDLLRFCRYLTQLSRNDTSHPVPEEILTYAALPEEHALQRHGSSDRGLDCPATSQCFPLGLGATLSVARSRSNFGDASTRQVHDMGMEQVLCAPRSQWHRAYIERVFGTIRRECLDHVIICNEAALCPHAKTFTA